MLNLKSCTRFCDCCDLAGGQLTLTSSAFLRLLLLYDKVQNQCNQKGEGWALPAQTHKVSASWKKIKPATTFAGMSARVSSAWLLPLDTMPEKAGGDEVTTAKVVLKLCFFKVTGLTLLFNLSGLSGGSVCFALSLLFRLFWDVWFHLNTVCMEKSVREDMLPAHSRVSRWDFALTVLESPSSSAGTFSASDFSLSASPNVDIFSEQIEQLSTCLQAETHTAKYKHYSRGRAHEVLTDFFFCGLKTKRVNIKCWLKDFTG